MNASGIAVLSGLAQSDLDGITDSTSLVTPYRPSTSQTNKKPTEASKSHEVNMQLAHLLLLLVLLVANANPVTSIEDQSAVYQTTIQRSLSDKVDFKRLELKDDDPSGVTNSASEERGLISSVGSKITSIFGKNPGLSSKLGSTQQNSEMIVAVAKMPIVKRLKTTMQKNPSFLKQLSNNPESLQKLAKDPQVAQVSAVMKENGFRFTKDSVNQLRSAAGKDPAKRGILEAIKGISKTKPLTIFEVVILLLVIASGPLVLGLILAIPDSATFR